MFAVDTGVSVGLGPGVLGLVALACILSAIVADGGKIGSIQLAIVKTLGRQIALGVCGLLLGGGAIWWALMQQQDKIFHVSGLDLSVDPPSYIGPCPAKIEFAGYIRTSGGRGGQVAYRFESEEGLSFSKLLLLRFEKAGSSQPVSRTLTVPRTTDSRAFIKLVSPDIKNSRHVRFRVTCR